MILNKYENEHTRRVVDMTNMFSGSTVVIIGGGPSILKQDLSLLDKATVSTLAINNSALIYKPQLWLGLDNPGCYSTNILYNPSIIKFMNMAHIPVSVDNTPVRSLPATVFIELDNTVLWEDMLVTAKKMPWYSNSFFSAVALSYYLGFRNIILIGCEFKITGRPYAINTKLNKEEIAWNRKVYKQQLTDLITLKPMFDNKGITITDCTRGTSLSGVYPTNTLGDELNKYITTTKEQLPHCSKFLPNESIKEK